MSAAATELPLRSLPTKKLVNDSFDYIIKRQRRKTIALHIMPDASVEVRAPKWVPKYEIIDFVELRSDWIISERRQVLKKLALKPGYSHGQQHNYLGQGYALQIERASRASVTFSDSILTISVRDPNSAAHIEKALERWYRQRAVTIYEERLFACFEAFPDWFQDKYRLPEISIRKMRRRWGSCSSRGDITLNLALIKMPIACIDYVISHELCHLEVFHHGKAFYHLLASVMPNWRERELLIESLS